MPRVLDKRKTGFQNGLAIAGDYMSAAAFLGVSGLIYMNGFDGVIYAVSFLVGWPVILFFMAEKLRNLDRKSTRLNSSHRSLSRMPSSA